MLGFRFMTAGLGLAVCSALASTSFAQGPPRPGQRAQGGQGGGFDPAAIFRRLDTNGDGTLTMPEVPQNERVFAERLLEMGGKPANGSLTRAEFMEIAERHRNGGAPPPRGPNNPPRQPNGQPPTGQPPAQPPAGQPPAERDDESDAQLPAVLQGVDANHDQRLTRAELTRFVRQFEELDTDGDGALDVAELSVRPNDSGAAADRNDATPSAGPARSGSGSGGTSRPRGSATGGSSRSGNTRSGGTRSTSGSRPAAGAANVSGVWRGWVVEGRGDRPNSGPLHMELTIENGRMSARDLGRGGNGGGNGGGEGLGNGNFELTSTGNSGNLDVVGTSGRHDGLDYLGIFEVDGDTLRWCVGNNGRPRPTEFATGRGNYFMLLHREGAQ